MVELALGRTTHAAFELPHLEGADMSSATTRRLAFAACLSAAGVLPAMGAASSALAAPPEDKFFTEVIDVEVPSLLFTQTCGFETWYALEATIMVSFHNNDLTIVRYPEWTRTLNGPGGSLSLRETGVDQIWTEVTDDGFIETVHSAGHFNHSWVVPGYGPVELNAGSAHFEVTYVWDEATQDFIVTEEVFNEGGPRDRELTDADIAALCGYLG
jgi:hypothetical protein